VHELALAEVDDGIARNTPPPFGTRAHRAVNLRMRLENLNCRSTSNSRVRAEAAKLELELRSSAGTMRYVSANPANAPA